MCTCCVPAARYDDLSSASDNIDLQTTILSRFDLIFIVRDVPDEQKDQEIARQGYGIHTVFIRTCSTTRTGGITCHLQRDHLQRTGLEL